MWILVLGLCLFIGVHLIPTRTSLRSAITSNLGVMGYKAAFSLFSLAGLVLIVIGKGSAEFIALWWPPVWAGHITKALMLPVFILLLAAYIPNNMKSKIKNPMLAAIKLWAVAHLIANGDLASILLFGSLLAFAVFDVISVKRRGVAKPVVQRPRYMDVIVVLLGLGLYGVVAMYHGLIFGVPLF